MRALVYTHYTYTHIRRYQLLLMISTVRSHSLCLRAKKSRKRTSWTTSLFGFQSYGRRLECVFLCMRVCVHIHTNVFIYTQSNCVQLYHTHTHTRRLNIMHMLFRILWQTFQKSVAALKLYQHYNTPLLNLNLQILHKIKITKKKTL